jgi:spermidine synthase
MLTPDRLADVQRALAQPAELNRDWSPVLYYYHLLHWVSQFRVRFSLLQGVLVAVLAVYLLRLRAVPFAIFVSGFAASALEVVLLLGFQILYGSVYQQLGVIITAFMAGLAAGAWIAGRLSSATSRRVLARLAFGIAALAAVLPFALRGMGDVGSTAPAMVMVQAMIVMLTFFLAVLVGMEFPVAARVQFEGGARTASRLYTADFVGAFLGALLASTLLIPVLGVTTVCLLTAGLNLLGGTVVLFGKG